MREELVRPDVRAAAIAARPHGVITVAQLRHAGILRSGVTRRVAAGRLHRVHRGVYALGHSGLPREAQWMAAVLACGDRAVLSHRSAAELWEVLPPGKGLTHVTVPASSGDRSARTGVRTVRKAIREAEYRGLDLGASSTDHTRSELERAFLVLCRRHGLPEPEVNARVGGFTVDFLWREAGLAVETDGYRAHRGRQAFEDDRERELALSTGSGTRGPAEVAGEPLPGAPDCS